MNSNNIESVASLYADNITFIDPFNEIHGLANLINYFSKLYKNVECCQFEFSDIYTKNTSAIITWDMVFKHRNVSKHKIFVAGSTQIRFDEKIYFHRDYFDAGQMIYEKIPVVGSVIKYIKRQV